MKIGEAAAILGVSPDISVENLKQTFRKLALHWHPDKCTKPNAKEKFQEISIAYTRLLRAQSTGTTKYEFDTEGMKMNEDSIDMTAFMRMFVDLVGMFNDEKESKPSVEAKISKGGVSFSMMFGSSSSSPVEECSTDEDEDYDDEDDEVYDSDDDENEDDESFDDEDNYDEDFVHNQGSDINHLERQVRHYQPMNSKEQVRKELLSAEKSMNQSLPNFDGSGLLRSPHDIYEARKKIKNAKKRAEKRRKQREKKLRESCSSTASVEQIDSKKHCVSNGDDSKQNYKTEDVIRLLTAEDKKRTKLILADAVRRGDVNRVKNLMEFPNSFENNSKSELFTSKNISTKESRTLPTTQPTERLSPEDFMFARASYLQEIAQTLPLLQLCVTVKTNLPKTGVGAENNKSSNYDKLATARYLLNRKSPPVGLDTTDGNGRTVLHIISMRGDLEFLALLAEFTSACPESLNIHRKCSKLKWTAFHYAAVRGDIHICRSLMKLGSSVSSRSGENDEGSNALELVQAKIVTKNGQTESSYIADLRIIEHELLRFLDGNVPFADGQTNYNQNLEKSTPAPAAKLNQNDVDAPPAPSKCNPSPQCNAANKLSSRNKTKLKKVESTPRTSNVAFSTATVQKPLVTTENTVYTSNDHMLDNLLAMGFSESDSLRGFSHCGRDLEAIVTWLCDNTSNATPPCSDERNSIAAENVVQIDRNIQTQHGKNAPAAMQTQPGRASHQKDKALKEELRRINKAWNQKAELEKKKIAEERKSKEFDRQKEISQCAQQLKTQKQCIQQLSLDQHQQHTRMYSKGNSTLPLPQTTLPTEGSSSYGGRGSPSLNLTHTQLSNGNYMLHPSQLDLSKNIVPARPQGYNADSDYYGNCSLETQYKSDFQVPHQQKLQQQIYGSGVPPENKQQDDSHINRGLNSIYYSSSTNAAANQLQQLASENSALNTNSVSNSSRVRPRGPSIPFSSPASAVAGANLSANIIQQSQMSQLKQSTNIILQQPLPSGLHSPFVVAGVGAVSTNTPTPSSPLTSVESLSPGQLSRATSYTPSLSGFAPQGAAQSFGNGYAANNLLTSTASTNASQLSHGCNVRYCSVQNDPTASEFVDGTLELSAGARPFVPMFSSPITVSRSEATPPLPASQLPSLPVWGATGIGSGTGLGPGSSQVSPSDVSGPLLCTWGPDSLLGISTTSILPGSSTNISSLFSANSLAFPVATDTVDGHNDTADEMLNISEVCEHAPHFGNFIDQFVDSCDQSNIFT